MIKKEFVLKGVNSEEVISRYESPYTEYNKDEYTNVLDLDIKSETNIEYFYDPNKFNSTLRITMMDCINFGPLPEYTDLYCWWDRNPFGTSPIGIPIRYIKDGTKIVYKDNIVNIPNKNKDYFETEGIFCSFPCCVAYINDNILKPEYRIKFSQSKQLLNYMYYKVYNKYINIEPAPSWRLLSMFGGHLSIDQFRSKFCKIVYKLTNNIKHPIQFPVGNYAVEYNVL